LGIAILNHATFVARGFAGDIPHLTDLLVKAISHKGFALLDVLQPCPTYNKTRPYNWYREHIYKLEETDYKPNDRIQAIAKTREEEKLPIGVFYQENKPTYHEQISSLKAGTLVNQSIKVIDITMAFQELK
jgi:2-oxoglutarate ferredoxin oxidoreductase subunit beta